MTLRIKKGSPSHHLVPADDLLEGDDVVEVLPGDEGQALQLLPDGVQGVAHPHSVHLRLKIGGEMSGDLKFNI